MGRVMAPRVVVFRADADDGARLPARVGSDDIHDGAVRPLDVGDLPAREYRGADMALVLVKVVAATVAGNRVVLAVVWLDSDDHGDARGRIPALLTRLGGDVVAQWPCTLVDGAFELPVLEADARPVAVAVKVRWPAAWRRRLPGDDLGDPLASPPRAPAAPTGPRILGVVVA